MIGGEGEERLASPFGWRRGSLVNRLQRWYGERAVSFRLLPGRPSVEVRSVLV